ncbi:MAG: DUF3343 domain-containing protein [Planctomycetes bacterium]|nr:DUF3343 domain-containing protein [Planctomycetota bacterium]
MTPLHAVILVSSTSHALRAERLLGAARILCRLIPVPRHLSSDCGVCVRVDRSDGERAVAVLESAKVAVEGLHEI